MNEAQKYVMGMAENLQNDCHNHVSALMKDSNVDNRISYQDATNVWLFQKLAELELRIHNLESYLVL